MGGQHIQLLPNARHIPVHLYNRSGTPSSGSRSSTPMGGRDSPEQVEDMRRVLESEYLKSASMSSSVQYNASMIVSEESMSPVHNGERSDGASSTRRKDGRRMPSKLEIPTGFSRQFSEDIETPTEITNLVRMIDETIDEQAELGMREQMTLENQNSFASRLSSKSSSGKLYLNIPKRSSMDTSGSASSSSPSASPTGSDDRKPTYAGVLRRRLPTSSEEIDPSMLEPQTPHTPAGFVSPGDDIDTDPLGILRNLNINASAENQRTYKYFS
ncbi:hypothetical protein FSP39_010333 [Pinctada imbricata]|uniref:Uncharacterized protein n=1 Tax=Pinctada imbricata TaxID=66713 RepID=A0AA88XY94_PINIB|nr:hypothetical protein FSP39_010333 [Pinctada imbricata]